MGTLRGCAAILLQADLAPLMARLHRPSTRCHTQEFELYAYRLYAYAQLQRYRVIAC